MGLDSVVAPAPCTATEQARLRVLDLWTSPHHVTSRTPMWCPRRRVARPSAPDLRHPAGKGGSSDFSVQSRGVAPPAAHAGRSSRSHAGSSDDDGSLPRDVPASLSTPCEERTVTGGVSIGPPGAAPRRDCATASAGVIIGAPLRRGVPEGVSLAVDGSSVHLKAATIRKRSAEPSSAAKMATEPSWTRTFRAELLRLNSKVFLD